MFPTLDLAATQTDCLYRTLAPSNLTLIVVQAVAVALALALTLTLTLTLTVTQISRSKPLL